jgi:NhaP-type Na+/H+ and K+/H+ antiporter
MTTDTWRTRLSALLSDAAKRVQGIPSTVVLAEADPPVPEGQEALWSAKLRAAVGADLAEFVLSDTDKAAGRQLSEMNLPEDCAVISIHRGLQVVVPRGHTCLQAGDRLIVLKVCTSCDTLRATLRDGSAASTPATPPSTEENRG